MRTLGPYARQWFACLLTRNHALVMSLLQPLSRFTLCGCGYAGWNMPKPDISSNAPFLFQAVERREELTAAEIRAAVAGFARSSTRRAISTALTDLLLYIGLLALSILSYSLWIQVTLILPLGLMTARLFVVGHDAAHGSLFPQRWLNEIFGRACFLPSATPYSCWQYAHNTVHHGLTNLRTEDPIWCPYSPSQFAALPHWRRWAERFYRSPFGFGVYYAVEIWWKELVWAWQGAGVQCRRRQFDRAHGAAFCLAVCAAGHGTLSTLCSLFGPLAVFWWLMGFTIFLHHTHPSVRWYAEREQWSFRTQLESTVHVIMPGWFNRFVHHIYDHTAHHTDTRIPFYELPRAQRALENVMRRHIIIENFSIDWFLRVVDECGLYDYGEHRWVSFKEFERSGK
jgi:acyl-lipid omega-6 desaturase (Delta-12 desaturase)